MIKKLDMAIGAFIEKLIERHRNRYENQNKRTSLDSPVLALIALLLSGGSFIWSMMTNYNTTEHTLLFCAALAIVFCLD